MSKPATTLLLAVPLLLLSNSAWAIPSPDLVINLFASVGQLLGMLSLALGGAAMTLRRRSAKKVTSPWPLRITLGLLFVTASGFGLYISNQLDLDNQRLRANLTRPSTEAGKQVGDVSLKTLSFSKQKEHPLGISTNTLDDWLNSGQPLNIIDVREPEETEAGMITNALSVGYPDLLKDPNLIGDKNSQALFLCFSGNRSSELCETLNAQGVDCRFMVGGYEKWLAEGRTLDSSREESGELRSLPYFPKQEILLETPEVQTLFNEENAQFVDVRYPGDFTQGHLPDAINLPLRKLTRIEAVNKLSALPKDRPIVAPCYDKRSCFYARILGLRLHRLGYDFRGRYTVPHEFTAAPKKARAHVQNWQEQQQDATLFGLIGQPLKWLLYELTNLSGNFFFAILFTVLTLRLLLLPFSIKAEVDRVKEARRAPDVKKLKKSLHDHPARLQRTLRRFNKEDKITPLRNTLGNVLQLILFLVLFTVIDNAAKAFGGSFLWLESIANPDPFYLLPISVSLIIMLHLTLSSASLTPLKHLMNLGFGILLLFLTINISAALNLYLVMSIGLLTLHGIAIRSALRRQEQQQNLEPKRDPADISAGIIPLASLIPSDGGGNKGLKLGEMLRMGLPVPDGFVVTNRILAKDELSDHDKMAIVNAWNRIDAHKVAVRSSGLNEDGADKSYAGVFESLLEIGSDKLFSALDEVNASLNSTRASAYSGQEESGGIVVQKMVDAQYAGVMFTEHPANAGQLMIEMVEGLGESLVSGQATPNSYLFGRFSRTAHSSEAAPIDLAPLIELGHQIEDHYGRPQDIEWAYADNQFYLLQTRDITSNSRSLGQPHAWMEQERYHLLDLFRNANPEQPILKQNDLSELMPHPSRFSSSFMERLWAAGGAVDIACSDLGIPYEVHDDSPPYVVPVFGSLYINIQEEERRTGKGPGMLTTFRLSRAAEALEEQFRDAFLPDYLEEVRIREALDFSRLPVHELVRLLKDWSYNFVHETYVQAEMINISAEYYLQTARQELEKNGHDPVLFMSQISETVVRRAMSLLPLIKTGQAEVSEFIDLFGHRAPHDFELSLPRYNEDPELVQRLIDQAQPQSNKNSNTNAPPELESKILRLSVSRAQRFQTLKEEAKHHCLRDLALLRGILLEIDSQLEMNQGIFELELDEVLQLGKEENIAQIKENVAQRQQEQISFEQPLPLNLHLHQLETLGLAEENDNSPLSADDLRGKRISGHGVTSGRVRVLTNPEDIPEFEHGEILVARFTDPSWTPVFSIASGIVTEVGGWLSHAAILARELNVVGIVGVADATRALRSGDQINLAEDGSIEVVKRTRRETPRYQLDLPLEIKLDGQESNSQLVDISRHGAQLKSGLSSEKSGSKGELRLPNSDQWLAFTTERNEQDAIGIRFEQPLKQELIRQIMAQCKAAESLMLDAEPATVAV